MESVKDRNDFSVGLVTFRFHTPFFSFSTETPWATHFNEQHATNTNNKYFFIVTLQIKPKFRSTLI